MKMYKYKRQVVALLLCVTMMLGFAPGTVNALEQTTDEGLTLSGDGRSSEVIALREENIKHFDMGDGTFQAIAYSHPIHERDSNGNWQDIDFGLTLTGARSSRMYANEEAGAAFAEKYVANQPIMSLSDEENSISMSLITTNANNSNRLSTNTAVVAEVTNPQNSFQTIEDAKRATFSSKVLYEEVLPNVDLEYIVDPGTVKENIIVKAKTDSYQYSFSLNLTGLYPVMQDDGSIIVYDQDADTKEYEIPAPFMYDAFGNVSEDVAYALTGTGNTYTLTVTANSDWINTEGRSFPVTIDPSYVVSTEDAYDTYIDSDSPDTAHGSSYMLWVRSNRISYIRVPTPSLPYYASVDWAALTAYYFYFGYVSSGTVSVSAHRVTKAWDEDTLTWNSATNWGNYGLSTTVLDTVSTVAGNATSNNPTRADFFITSTFKSWVNGSSPNYGIGLQYATDSTNLSVVFKSMNTGYDFRPRITYQYFIPNVAIRLFGVSNEGHDHLSGLTYVSDLLDEYGYTNNSVLSGAFLPSEFKLQLQTADVVTTRSHGVVCYEANRVQGTGLLLNDDEEAKYYFLNKEMWLSCAYKAYISAQDSFDNLELCLFVGCNTALDGTDGTNLSSCIVEQGCETSVGFADSVLCSPANTWTKLFYTYLIAGHTVQESVDYACAYVNLSTGLKSAVIYGNEDYRLGG